MQTEDIADRLIPIWLKSFDKADFTTLGISPAVALRSGAATNKAEEFERAASLAVMLGMEIRRHQSPYKGVDELTEPALDLYRTMMTVAERALGGHRYAVHRSELAEDWPLGVPPADVFVIDTRRHPYRHDTIGNLLWVVRAVFLVTMRERLKEATG